MDATQFEKYGFGSGSKWRDRLALLGLTSADAALALRLRDEVVAPNLDAIVSRFYETLLSIPETRQFLTSAATVAHLQSEQRKYLLGLGVDFESAAYCASRLRVGMAHVRAGLPLSVYLCAYARLQHLVLAHFPPALAAREPDRRMMAEFVLRVMALDAAIATESYHLVKVERLEDSIGELRDEASTDMLTGIANRKRALAALDAALAAARSAPAPLCVMMADLDHFKVVNDTLGHLVGDEVLRSVARRMHSAMRGADVIGRYGGEEFVVVLRDTSRPAALEVAERIRRRVADGAVTVQGLEIPVTVSIGIAEARAADSAPALIKRADEALYVAKRSGRDRVATLP